MAVINLIFANFWTWLGALIFAATILSEVADIIKAAKKPRRNVRVTTYGDKTSIVEISNATPEDVRKVVSSFQVGGPACIDWEGGV